MFYQQINMQRPLPPLPPNDCCAPVNPPPPPPPPEHNNPVVGYILDALAVTLPGVIIEAENELIALALHETSAQPFILAVPSIIALDIEASVENGVSANELNPNIKLPVRQDNVF